MLGLTPHPANPTMPSHSRIVAESTRYSSLDSNSALSDKPGTNLGRRTKFTVGQRPWAPQ